MRWWWLWVGAFGGSWVHLSRLRRIYRNLPEYSVPRRVVLHRGLHREGSNAVHVRFRHAIDFGAERAHLNAPGFVDIHTRPEALQRDSVIVGRTEFTRTQGDNEAQGLFIAE